MVYVACSVPEVIVIKSFPTMKCILFRRNHAYSGVNPQRPNKTSVVSGSTVLRCCRSNAGPPEKCIFKIFSRKQTKDCFLQRKKLLMGL